MVLFEDETILRLFPPLRAKWAWRGSQPEVRVSGANARRVLFGTIRRSSQSRHDHINGRRFREPEDVEFSGVHIETGRKKS